MHAIKKAPFAGGKSRKNCELFVNLTARRYLAALTICKHSSKKRSKQRSTDLIKLSNRCILITTS